MNGKNKQCFIANKTMQRSFVSVSVLISILLVSLVQIIVAQQSGK